MAETSDSFKIGALRKSNEESFLPQASSETTHTITKSFPATTVVAAAQHKTFALLFAGFMGALDNPISFGPIIAFADANDAIEAKAATLGSLAGSPLGDTVSVPDGYMRSYQGCDIYYSKADGAHEVHGDIRAKYNALGGAAGVIGIPVTDESGTPDGIGRFNHFSKGGSIYWTPTTGPMLVRGVIRNQWASNGWERGPMGYPVADEYRLRPFNAAQDHPDVAWSLFQNGAIFSKGDAVANAVTANLPPDALKNMIRTFFDRGLKKGDSNLGLEARVDFVSVSNWSYGFWGSIPRSITYRLHGFYDDGSLNPIPDPTFEIEVQLLFGLASPQTFTYPSFQSLYAALGTLSVSASGVGAGKISKRISDGIEQTFKRGGPDPEHPEVSDGAVFITTFPTGVDQKGSGNIDVIGVLTTAQGGLQVLLNPLPVPSGAIRQEVAQQQIDAFLENF